VSGEHGTGHRRTLPCHPWANSQAERMNRTVKDATAKARYGTTQVLCAHVLAFVAARASAQHLKAPMADTVPGHPQRLEHRPNIVQDQPAPSHPGTIHLNMLARIIH